MKNGLLSHRTPLPDETDEFASDGATVVDPRFMAPDDEFADDAAPTRQGEVLPSEGPTRHADISALIARSPAARAPEPFEPTPTVAAPKAASNDVELDDVTVEDVGPGADGAVSAPMAPLPTNRFRMDLVPPTWWESNGRKVVRGVVLGGLLLLAGVAYLVAAR